jgi:hypothetical protein
MAGMTAIVLHDLGTRRESRAWFATAARAAAESGDDQLHAWVLAREAMVLLNYGASKAAAGLAERARRAAGHRPTAAAVLAAAVAARAYALNHQGEQARAALEAADALTDRLPEGERSDTWLMALFTSFGSGSTSVERLRRVRCLAFHAAFADGDCPCCACRMRWANMRVTEFRILASAAAGPSVLMFT